MKRKHDVPLTPLAWAQHYLAEYFSDEPADFHRELFADLAASKRLLARVAPRGHAKSTCATLAYPLWCLCRRMRRNIVIITHETELARQFLRDIRQELETNERILADYGELAREPDAPVKRSPAAARGKKSAPDARRRVSRRRWSQDQFITAAGLAVHARGSGASLRGVRVGPQRPDLIILDDVEHDQQVRSPLRRRRLENWLRRAVMPALAPGGQLVVLGSLLHHDSLLARLADRTRFPRWDYRVYRAIEFSQVAGSDRFEPVPLWQARWPIERLHEERERIGLHAFEQEYQANPVDETTRLFHPELWQRCAPGEFDHRPRIELMAVDPATGKDGRDYFAIWVGGLVLDDDLIFTRELTLERIGIVEQVQRVVAAWRRWRPARIGIETIGYQDALYQTLVDESRRLGLYMPLVRIGRPTHKDNRIAGLAPLIAAGRLRFPATLAPEVELQFVQYPNGAHDDAPDVCALGVELARQCRAERPEARGGQNGRPGQRQDTLL